MILRDEIDKKALMYQASRLFEMSGLFIFEKFERLLH